MKLTKKLPNGKFKVNKAAVIAELRKRLKAKREVQSYGLLPVSDREIASEVTEMTRYNADSLLNTSEE
jgi:hypothetical protein